VVFRLNFSALTASDGGAIVEVVGTLDTTVDTRTTGEVITYITTKIVLGPGSTASSFLYFEAKSGYYQFISASS
jgi:hypothetical protein